MAYNAELQMLREFFLLYASREVCCFCGRPILLRKEDASFGHRRHTKVWELNFTVHHKDENRSNNADDNLAGCHNTCHRRFHKTLLLKGGPHRGDEKDQEGQKG